MIKIRNYSDEDQEQVVNLITKSLWVVTEVDPAELEDLDDVKKNFEKFFVAEEDGIIIGTLGIKDERDALISQMYVAAEEKGRGIGTKLMEKAIDYCKTHKYKRMFLSTHKELESIGFYEKFGFNVYRKDNLIWMEGYLDKDKD